MSHDFVVISLCFTFTCNNFTSAHNKFYVSEKMPIYRNNILPAIGSKILCMLCAWSSLGSEAMHGVYHIQSGNIMATMIIIVVFL